MSSRLLLGARVRVVLNGRRVGGWVVDIAPHGDRDHHVALDRLSSLQSLSGAGVAADLVPLTQWVSRHWFGSWRSVLASATAPRVRERSVHPRRGAVTQDFSDSVTDAVRDMWAGGGGLIVVPPLASSLSCVVGAASHGTVLVICPTIRMAVAGAAALRRRGLTTALLPDDWDNARSGVDVVIGARSGVFAPVNRLSSIVVIDEHDESLHEERAPTWNAVSVARERAHRASVPFFATSPVPSVEALFSFQKLTRWIRGEREWPTIVISDLNDVPVKGSLLTTEMLDSVRDITKTAVCVLNTKGKSRLLVCKSCRHVQRCPECLSLLSQDGNAPLFCGQCAQERGAVCGECGRSSFVVLRGGVGQLREQIEANSQRDVVEISSDAHEDWARGQVFIGTEAVLFRVPSADVVVFADIDRDLGAPRMSAGSEVLALIARAARIVGATGTVVIQTRHPDHPLIQALSSSDVVGGVRQFIESELAKRMALHLPPVSRVVRVGLPEGAVITEGLISSEVMSARDADGLLLRSESHDALSTTLHNLRREFGTTIRVYADPRRF